MEENHNTDTNTNTNTDTDTDTDTNTDNDTDINQDDVVVQDISLNTTSGIRKPTDKIKHIVCAGGGIAGLQYYGILEEAYREKLWHIDNIQTYYGTSIGTIIGVCILLNYDWVEITKYFTQRPFEKLFPFGLKTALQSISKLGLYNIETIRKLLSPFLLGSDLSVDITMKEFYEETKIEFHCITTNVKGYNCVDVSHKTHPEWKLVDAVYASCALPILFEPLHVDGEFYADGCLLYNYPLYQCIQNGADPNEILGITPGHEKKEISLSQNDTMFEYLGLLLHQMTKNDKPIYKDPIAYQFEVYMDNRSPNKVRDCILSGDHKVRMINEGKLIVLHYLQGVDIHNTHGENKLSQQTM